MNRNWLQTALRTFGASVGLAVLGATITVDPDATGSDRPLNRALTEARRLRAQGGEAVLELSGGRFELSRPLALGPADSGIVIRARTGERPVLSGGTKIRGWKRTPGTAAVWEVNLPDVREGRWYFNQLFVNGVRAQRARTPNEGFFHATGRLGTNSPIELPFRSGDVRPEWAGQRDARLVMLMKWTDLHTPLAGVSAGGDSGNGIAMLVGGPRPYWMDEPDARYWVENTPDALDAPGEWFLDRPSGTLRYLAPAGLDPNSVPVVAPRLTELGTIRGNSTGTNPVTGIRMVGLTFAESDYTMPDAGLISPQAAVPVPGTLRLENATGGMIEDCTFENLGGYALELGTGVQDWRVTGNAFRSLGAGGIRVGEPGGRNPSPASANHSHLISDNSIVGLGRIFAPAVGIIVFNSGTNRIAHNHISDLYYTGISVGWNWGYEATPCRGNVIEFNLVERVGQDRLSDMGGIYTLGPQPGTVIRNNVFRDISSHGYGGWGLYTDEGSTGILLENNVVYRCKSAGFHQHYGRDNVVRNNLIAFNREHELMRTRAENHRSFWFTNNIVIWNSGGLLGSNWSGTTNQFLMDHNLYFDTRMGTQDADYRFNGLTLSEWQGRGQDLHSRIADPRLVDPDRPELGLLPGSPAYELGFQAINLSDLGPRPRERRR